MSKLENKSSSATLVDPPHSYRTDIPAVPPIPDRAPERLVGHTHGGSERGSEKQMTEGGQTPGSPFSASFNPNGPPPAQVSSLPTPPTLPHVAPEIASIITPPPPSQLPAHAAHAQPSPFSASFDPNATPSHTAAQHALHTRLSSASLASSNGSIHVAQEQWNHIMSTSLSALANQFQAASRAMTIASSAGSDGTYGSRHAHDESLASYRTSESGEVGADDSISDLALARTGAGVNTQGVETMLSLMMSRLENVERNQVRLGGEIERVRDEVKTLKRERSMGGPSVEATPVNKNKSEGDGYFVGQRGDKAKMKENEITVEGEEEHDDEWQKRVEILEKKVDSILETLKVDQARLYPRLQNAFVTLNKQNIKPLPVQGTGKAPVNFPATKGEFEHLTKERYEDLMKSYGIPLKGDTAAKREAVREFIGLTPPGK